MVPTRKKLILSVCVACVRLSCLQLHSIQALQLGLPKLLPVRTGKVQQKPSPAPSSGPSLGTWLESNNAVIESRIGTDENGLRGLVLDKRADNSKLDDKTTTICRIPRGCIIEADPHHIQTHNRPIDALAASLLEEIKLGETSHYYPYIEHMPGPNDLSLAGIGGTWTDEQLDRLCHDCTKQKFIKLRTLREEFIRRHTGDDGSAMSETSLLAGWAYDLASSRALQGPFGKRGKVRAAVAGTVMSMTTALVVPALMLNRSNGLSDGTVLLELAVPFVISMSALVTTLLSKEPELAMLPWIDIANHQSKSRLYLEYDILSDGIVLKTDGDENYGVVEEDMNFINFDYGGASQGVGNDKLLGEYGFVEEDNPNDTFNLQVGKRVVRIGRNGRLFGTNFDDEEVNSAAKESLDKLVSADSNQSFNENEASEPVDFQRAMLATSWRKEKIRLLNEFLAEPFQ